MIRTGGKRYRMSRAGYSFSPELELWEDYVRKVAGHNKSYVYGWCVDDESELSWAPDQFAEVVDLTADAVHQSTPGVLVGLSAMPEFCEAMLKFVDVKKIDFGGSSVDRGYWESLRIRRLQRRYDNPWVCYGVGNRTVHTMYHTLYTYQPVQWTVARMARKLIYMYLLQDLNVAGHYAAILRNDGAHIAKNKPLRL